MRKEALKIKEHFTVDSYKEKADLHVTEDKVKKALAQVMMANTSAEKSVDTAGRAKRGGVNKSDSDKFKIAAFEFQALLKDMDEDCLDFVSSMK